MRNLFFDRKIFRSATFDFPVICIGNLSLGGTGKTPMVEYLVKILQENYQVATLSRGYKRKTKGFFIATSDSKTSDIGDEPMQFYLKFPDITVAVDEDRVLGIPKLLNDKPQTEIIILDDAFQHREVTAGLNLLLTAFSNPYSSDFIIPAGSLRDVKKSSERADIIVVTKCNSNLTAEEKQSLIHELNPKSSQTVFFSTIEYGSPYHLFGHEIYRLDKETHVLLISGIANPETIESGISSKVGHFETLRYTDHHIYDSYDLKKIQEKFSKMDSLKKIILTTEKDATRLLQFEKELREFPVYVLPMAHRFLFDEAKKFENEIVSFVNSYKVQRIDVPD